MTLNWINGARYLEVDKDNGAELFYYFVESESSSGDTADTPFLLWLTGGNRCSVFSGMAFEIGMCCTRTCSEESELLSTNMMFLTMRAGPIRFILEPYNGTLPRLRYNQHSWSKVSSLCPGSSLGPTYSNVCRPAYQNYVSILHY